MPPDRIPARRKAFDAWVAQFQPRILNMPGSALISSQALSNAAASLAETGTINTVETVWFALAIFKSTLFARLRDNAEKSYTIPSIRRP